MRASRVGESRPCSWLAKVRTESDNLGGVEERDEDEGRDESGEEWDGDEEDEDDRGERRAERPSKPRPTCDWTAPKIVPRRVFNGEEDMMR